MVSKKIPEEMYQIMIMNGLFDLRASSINFLSITMLTSKSAIINFSIGSLV